MYGPPRSDWASLYYGDTRMSRRSNLLRVSGELAVVEAGAPALPFITSGTAPGPAHQGYSAGITEVSGGAFGTASPVILPAPGGRVIKALYFDATGSQTYIVLDGTTHVAFLTGLTVWVGGIARGTFGAATRGGVSYAILAGSNIVPNPGNYTVSFVAP
jgi:hypothetical protein